jgi:hypothetical protein
MKKTLLYFSAVLFAAFSLSSCIKQDDVVFEGTTVEIDWATYNARTAGFPFPLLIRVPQEPGRGVITSNLSGSSTIDPALTRTYASTVGTDTITMRVNLVGRQLSTAQTFSMGVASAFTTAVQGVHFALVDNSVTIPANSSFGFFRWRVLNPGPTNGIAVNLVFQLRGNGSIPVSENFQYLGWQIGQ